MAADQAALLSAVKEAIARLTAPGNGRESGASVDEIATEVRSQLGHRLPPFDLRSRLSVLLLQPPHSHLFHPTTRTDGAIGFRNAPANPIFGEFRPLLFADPRGFPPPMPETVCELKDEVGRLQTRKTELLREEQNLLLCQQLLQNPTRIQDESQRLATVLLNMREVQCIIDYKVQEVLDFMRHHGPDAD
jgi:hypothetical protein